MPTLMIAYDLNRPGQDYSGLIARIKRHGPWWHHLDSTWFVRTTLSASEMRDDLGRFLDSGDELLVMNVSGDWWAGRGFDQRAYDWFRDNL